MRRLIAALAFAIPVAAHASLPVGAPAPDFTTQGALAGKPFNFQLSKALKKGPVVLYFFPAAFTPGCTIEARQFAIAADDFAKAGATLIGVAADPIDKLAKFSVEECRNKFPVAVATPVMITGYDVTLPQLNTRSNRTSYVIGRNGRVAFAYSAMAPDDHVKGTLAAVRRLKSVK
jgi:thioredoxin-dependent peroxiredoxin